MVKEMARSDEIEVLNECEELRKELREKEKRGMASSSSSSSDLNGIADFIVKSLDSKFTGSSKYDADILYSSQPVLGHCNTAPVRSGSFGISFQGPENIFPRSKTEKRDPPKVNLTLDKLSETEKKKIIENLVKIQKDGTVQVDVTQDSHVASELLELDSAPFNINPEPILNSENNIFNKNKSVPKLNIAMLVVGTRGDVQPFIAFAKRLQEFGHNVRLATHVNFKKFVKSSGVDFYPLGGDPRIMAGYMARTKGFLLSGPTEISIQRKQLKEIIYSLLPACTEPDLDTAIPFRAQAIIANPPAYVGRS